MDGEYSHNNGSRFTSPPPQRINPPRQAGPGGARDSAAYDSQHFQHEDPEVYYTETSRGRVGAPPVNVEEPVGLAGIGILLERSGSKSITAVRSIQPMSSADREGTLKPGDELVAVNGHDTSTWDLAKVKRVLVGRNGSTCVLTVRQKGAHSAIDVTLMRGCLEWWELHDRVSVTEQQLAESETSAQEFRQMWMVESKRAASESTQREELSIELEGYRAALASTRNALRVADDELAKEYAKTSELKIELSRLKASLEGQLKEQQDFMERTKEAMAACDKAQGERDEAEKEIRKLRQEIEDLKRQASGAEEERDLSHRMYREVDFARKTAMQRLADAQAQLALLTSDNEAMKKDLQSLQQDKDRDNGLKQLAEKDIDAARRLANDAQRELKEQKALKDRLEEEKQALSNEVVRLQTMLADKEQQIQATLQKMVEQQKMLNETIAANAELEGIKAQLSRENDALRSRAQAAGLEAASADMKADAHLQRIPPLEKAAAKVGMLQQELETTLSKLRDTEKEFAVLEAKLAHSMASEAALELRIKSTDKKMGEELSNFQGLKREHEDLTLKYRELETSYKSCQAAKDLLVEYRGTIEDLQDGLKSQTSEVIRLKEALAALLQENDNCKREIEQQRKKFDESMQQKQSEITEKMLASHLNLENAQKSFDAKLKELTEKEEQQKTQHEMLKLEFADKLRAKDLEIEKDLAELQALKHDFDKRVEKERINLLKSFKEQTDDLHEQLKQLLKLKESADKEHDAEIAKCKAELSDRIHQFTRDQDDLNQQWSVRYEALVKNEEAEKARIAAANARKVESLQSDLKQEQDDRNRIIASIPEKVQKECEVILRQKQVDLDALNKAIDARIASERMSVATEWQLKMDERKREQDTAIGKVKDEWQDKVSKLSAQLQDQLRRQAELEELAKSVESRIASERMSVALEWQLKMDELEREHDEAIGKVKSDCQEKYMVLKNEVMTLKNECQDKVNEERRKYDENMAKISRELKDQLSQEKVKWIEQHGAIERDLREKCAYYQQERDHVKAEFDRFYKLPNPVGVGLALKYSGKSSHDLEDIVIEKLVPGLSADLCGILKPGMHLMEIDHHTILHMDMDEVKERVIGKRGSRVVLKFADKDGGAKAFNGGRPFHVILKRGAWGAEHCVVENEDRDMVDKGSWPVMSDMDRFAEASFQPWQRDSPQNRSGPPLQSPRRASPPMESPRFQGHTDQALA